MADVGEIRAKVVAETDQFEAGMQKAAAATEKFSSEADKNLQEVNQSLKSIKWAEAGQGIQRMGNALRSAGKEWVDAAASLDDLSDSLKGAFGDNADQVADWSNKIGTAFGVFSKEQVGAAATSMQRFGDVTEDSLRRVADIAAGSGQSMEAVAAAYGKFEKFGDSKSLLALQKQLGVTSQELQGFGAVLDSNGKILADTPARAEAARAAMEALLDEKFGGAMERQSDASAQLAGHMELLQQKMGAGALELKENMAPAMLDFVMSIEGLPGPLLGAMGIMTEFGGAALQMAGGGLEAAANLSTLANGLQGLKGALGAAQGALAALAGPAGLMVVAAASVAALALAFAAYTRELENANKAAEDLLATEEKRERALHKNKDLIGKNADEYRKLGKNARDAQDVVIGLQEQISTARANGASPQVIARLERDLATAQAARKDLSDDPGAPKNVQPAGPRTPGRVEESEKQREAREKKEAAAKAAAEKKAAAAEAKRRREEAARKRREEAARRAAEAKRQREQSAREKAADRKRRAQEKQAERERQKAEKERQSQAKDQKKTTEKKQEKAQEKTEAAAALPGFFDKFAQDSNTVAFKDIMAKNAARREGEGVFLSDGTSTGPFAALDAASGLLAGMAAISPAAAAAATATSAGKGGAGQETATAVKEALDEITIVLEVKEGARSQKLTGSGRPGKPVKFDVSTPLGGVTG